MTAVRPFLMFQENNAEEAMQRYVALFDDGEVLELTRYDAAGPGVEGSVQRARFRIGGQEIWCIDSPIKHAFAFTPASSLFVDFDDEAQLERCYAALLEGGTALMPLGSYGFSRRFGWVNDRYGVSFQLNLP